MKKLGLGSDNQKLKTPIKGSSTFGKSQSKEETPKEIFLRSNSLPEELNNSMNLRKSSSDDLNQSFTEKRQLKKLETKPNSNKTNQKVLNRVLQPLDNFPLHGLKFSGKDDSEEETIYKKELRQFKERETTLPSFKESLVFKLSGISEILRNPQFTPENPQPQKQETRTPRKSYAPSKTVIQMPENKNNLAFITDLARKRYSKKVIDFLYKINDAENGDEISDILKENKNIQRLLKSFNEENREKITNSPLVFSKYALSAELLIIAKQLYVLEKTNPTIKTNKGNKKTQDSHIAQNADLLFAENSDAKEKMIKFIERKCQFLEEQNDNLKDPNPVKGVKTKSEDVKKPKSPPMQKIYENKSKAAVNSSCFQYQTLCENGKLPIYLKDPTTRSFRSKNGISLPQGVTVSEDQYNILHEIDGAISKQQGTKIYARLPTGAGKSHLEKLMNEMFLKVNDNENIDEELTPLNKFSPAPAQKISPAPNNKGIYHQKKIRSSLSPAPNNTPQSKLPANSEVENAKTALIQSLININLNISAEELQQINERPDLKRNIVIADEAFFFSRLFLEGKINYKTDGNINKSDIEQIEKLKDQFIKDLQNKGAIVLVMGASESLDKIGHEINRIEGKIFKEEAKIAAQSNKKLIIEANTYFYSDKTNRARKIEPIYKEIINEQVGGKNLKEQIVTVTDRSKQSILGGNPSKAEFLVKTAFYIKQLSQFLPPELQESDEVKNVIDSLIPQVPGGKKDQSFGNLDLTATLLGSGIFDATKIDKAPALARNSNLKKTYKASLPKGGASIDTRKLQSAVDAFFEKKLDDNSFLYNQLPKDQQQERASDGSKLGNLKEKLKVRQYQYRDLQYRRDKLTKDRFDRSEIVVETQSDNLELEESQQKQDESNNEVEKKSALFAIVEKNLPQLEAGKKMQYILPDFNINDETCSEEVLRELKGHADIIIIPHFNEEEKKLKCKIAYYSENDLFGFKECEIDNLNSEIKEAKRSISLPQGQKPSIISFFDRKNAIGGDYKDASVNISKQYIQLTKEDCFSNKNDFLTWNHLMQFNRDRTDLDSIDLNKLELKFILPESSIIKDKNDVYYDKKEIIKELLDVNTQKHDEIVLEGYKMYKGITQDPNLHVNFKRGSHYSSNLAIDLNDVSNFDQSSLKKEPDDENNSQVVETEEDRKTSILLEGEIDITEELEKTNNDDNLSQSEKTIEENFNEDEESIVELDEELESEEDDKANSKQQQDNNKNFYGEDENSDLESDFDENEKDVVENSNLYKDLGAENLGSVFDQEFKEKVDQENTESLINDLTNEIVYEIIEKIEELDKNVSAEKNRLLSTIEEENEVSDSEEEIVKSFENEHETKFLQNNPSLNSLNQTFSITSRVTEDNQEEVNKSKKENSSELEPNDLNKNKQKNDQKIIHDNIKLDYFSDEEEGISQTSNYEINRDNSFDLDLSHEQKNNINSNSESSSEDNKMINTTIILDNYLEEEGENKNEIKEVINGIITGIEFENKINTGEISPIKKSRSNSDYSTHDLDGDSFPNQSNLYFEETDLEQESINSQGTKNKEELEQKDEKNISQSSDIVVPLKESSQINLNEYSQINPYSENSGIGRNRSGSTSVISKSSVILNLSSVPSGGGLSSSQVDSKLETSENFPEKVNKVNEELSSSREIPHYSNKEKFETPSPSPNSPELGFNFYDNIKVAEDFIAYEMTINKTNYRKQATGQEQQKVVILKELYKLEEGLKILDNIFYMMIKSANDSNLSLQQALRALEIAKERKGIANGADPDNLPDDFYLEEELEEDSELFNKYSDFEQKFQEYCYDCGIFSFLEELQGLRLCNIPKDSDERFFDFINQLQEDQFSEKIISDSEAAYKETMDNFRKISNQRREEVEAEEKADLGR